MEKKSFKVLLISGNNFNKQSNNGRTFEAIFNGFDKKNIAQLYFQQIGDVDFEYCENYYTISVFDVLKSIVNPWRKTGRIVTKDISSNESIVADDEMLRRKKIPFYAKYFRGLIWKLGHWNTSDLKHWLKKSDPDFIFYVGGPSASNINIALSIVKYLNKPIVTYFTDDYLINPIRKNLLDRLDKLVLDKCYKKIIAKSVLCFTIGELMSEQFSKYFNREFYTIMNSVPIKKYIEYSDNKKINISYLGGLTLNRWKMIVRLGKYIPENVNIEVYSMRVPDQYILSEFSANKIDYCGAVTGDELNNVIINSDVLIHVESDDLENRSFTKYSVSTKIPEYLASGRPVFGFGPSEVASMRILSDNHIGFQISSDDDDDSVKRKLHTFISDYQLRKQIGNEGYKYAVEKFNNEKNVEEFMMLVTKNIE